VRDDVVEGLLVKMQQLQVALAKVDVREVQRARVRAPACEGGVVQVDADERRVRQAERHRDQVAPVAAAELEHARRLHPRRVQPAQRGLRGHAARVRLGEGVARVRQRVVGGPCRVGGACALHRGDHGRGGRW
jgi:hypothetical protein